MGVDGRARPVAAAAGTVTWPRGSPPGRAALPRTPAPPPDPVARGPGRRPGGGGAQDPARRADRPGPQPARAARQAGQARRPRRARRAAARPLHRGRADRRRRLRPGLGARAGSAAAVWPAAPWPRSCGARASTTRRPGPPSTTSTPPTRRRPPARWSARSCGPCAASTPPPRPDGWPACWPARATPRGWRSPSSATSSGRSTTIRHDGPMTVAHLHRLPPGAVDLTAIPTDATPGFDGGKTKGKAALFALGDELSDLQERLWAERTTGSERRRAAGAAGHGHLGQGRRAPPHGRPGRPAGREDHQLQGADRRGAQAPTSCGGSATRCPSRATSASSTAPTTRTS